MRHGRDVMLGHQRSIEWCEAGVGIGWDSLPSQAHKEMYGSFGFHHLELLRILAGRQVCTDSSCHVLCSRLGSRLCSYFAHLSKVASLCGVGVNRSWDDTQAKPPSFTSAWDRAYNRFPAKVERVLASSGCSHLSLSCQRSIPLSREDALELRLILWATSATVLSA